MSEVAPVTFQPPSCPRRVGSPEGGAGNLLPDRKNRFLTLERNSRDGIVLEGVPVFL